MVTLAQARKLALALPEATEQDHHGRASFRVNGKIFATVPDDGHLNVMVDEHEIRALAASAPDVFAEVWWGAKLSAVRVALAAADRAAVAEVLEEAWRRKAPKRLLS